LPEIKGTKRLGPPISNVGKIVSIALNYRDHASEVGSYVPSEPILFMKATTVITGSFDAVILPKGSTKTDWEVELGIVIGSKTQYVNEDEALDHVAGYLICEDLSEREFQSEHEGQMTKVKSAYTFAPVGPWLVTKDGIRDPQNLNI